MTFGIGVVFSILAFCLFFDKNSFNSAISNRYYVLNFILITAFLFLTFFWGEKYMTISDPFVRFYKSIFFILFSFLCIPLVEEFKNRKLLIYCFLFGIFIYSVIVVSYSYMINPVKYGYKFLYSPFLSRGVSSTVYSNNLAVLFCFGLILLVVERHILLKIFSIVIISTSLLSVFFTLGRSFIIIGCVFLTIFLLSLIDSVKKIFLFLMAILFIVSAGYLMYVYALPDTLLDKFDRLMINRFSVLFSDKDPRTRLWKEGFELLFKYPMGGYTPMSVPQYWYHNIWLDTARVAGLIPVGIFLFFNLIIVHLYFVFWACAEKKALVLLSLVCLMVLGQDLVLESAGRIHILYLYIFIQFVLVYQAGINRGDRAKDSSELNS